MTYLAVTKDAELFLGNYPEDRKAVCKQLPDLLSNARLRNAIGAARELRLAQSTDGKVLALWHPDYLSGTGDEDWGFITVTGDEGLLAHSEILEETFERALYVVGQRLQGLLVDDRLIHKKLDG